MANPLVWLAPPLSIQTGYSLRIENLTDYTSLVFRRSIPKSVNIIAPLGASVSWQLVESVSRRNGSPTVVAYGYDRVISYTPTRLTDASSGEVLKYDILLTATIAGTTIPRVYDHGIIIAPPKRTVGQANTHINLDTESSGSFTSGGDGYIYVITGNLTKTGDSGVAVDFLKQLKFQNVTSSDPENPVHVYGEIPGRQLIINPTTGAAAPLYIATGCRNVYFDFAGNDTIRCGLKALYSVAQASNDHGLSIQTASGSTNASTGQTGITIVGVEIDGQNNCSSGLRIQGDNTGVNVYSTWEPSTSNYLNRFNITNISIYNTIDEGVYVNRTSAGSGASAYSGLKNSYLWNFIISHTGNEPWQMSTMVNSEAHGIYATDVCYRNNTDHNNLYQLIDNKNFYFYQFFIQSNTNGQIGNLLTGTKTINTNIFNGILVNRQTVNSNHFMRQDASDVSSTIPYRISRLTVDSPNGAASAVYFIQKNPGGTTYVPLVISNSAHISNNPTLYTTSGSPTQTDWHVSENSIETLGSAYGFRNYSTNDYRPATPDSLLFDTIEETWVIDHPSYNFDYQGFGYINDLRGACSDWMLHIGAPPTEITSVVESDPIIVDQGTEFASLVLPAQCLVNLADGSERWLDVTWQEGDYDGDVIGEYTLSGTLTLPDDILNAGGYTGSIDVSVEDLPNIHLKISSYLGTHNTSTTSLNLTTLSGSFTLNIGTGKFFGSTEATPVLIRSRANPTVDYIDGVTSAYNSGTGVLTIATGYTKNGSGAHTDWDVDLKGWWETGSLAFFPGTNTTRDYGLVSDIDGSTSHGIGFRALNTSSTTRWNATAQLGSQSASGTGVYPNGAMIGYNYVQNQAGTIELYGVPIGRAFTIKAFASRASGTSSAGRWYVQNNVAGAVSYDDNNNISTVATFTGVMADSNGVIKVTCDTTGSASGFYRMNVLEIISE